MRICCRVDSWTIEDKRGRRLPKHAKAPAELAGTKTAVGKRALKKNRRSKICDAVCKSASTVSLCPRRSAPWWISIRLVHHPVGGEALGATSVAQRRTRHARKWLLAAVAHVYRHGVRQWITRWPRTVRRHCQSSRSMRQGYLGPSPVSSAPSAQITCWPSTNDKLQA
jgi:hypothetical protein